MRHHIISNTLAKFAKASALITLLACGQSHAAAKVDYLNVVEDIVYFSTAEEKPVASPSCVAAENASQYAISLSSQNGRTLYSLLATALAGNLNVTVVSALDCAVVDGFERAFSISVAPTTLSQSTPSSGGGKGFYLFTGDGATKIGRVINEANGAYIAYVPQDNPVQAVYYKTPSVNTTLYYEGDNCTGSAYMWSARIVGYFPDINGGSYGKSGTQQINFYQRSYYQSGTCHTQLTQRSNMYMVDFSYDDPLCGTSACIMKED